MKINYRPEIDGLRSLAVISVIIYHANINIGNIQFLNGGFFGVDIFFVISGYLISFLIFKELSEKKIFSFSNFYKRRIRRIIPALLFVMMCSLPIGWIILPPSSFISLSESILSSIGFVSNIYFHFSGIEYDAWQGLFVPLLHNWSLSIEEQFYIIFPLFIIIVFNFCKKYLLIFLIFCFVSSFLMHLMLNKNYPSTTFYFLHTRIWELICGSLIAYYEIKLDHRNKNKILSQLMPIIGIGLIIFSIFFFDNKTFHPSFYTLIPVVGVALILWFSNKNDIVTKILSYRIFVAVGLISYSLYLWHYPLFSFAKNLEIFYDNHYGKFLLIIISIILSIITYYLIEQPARKSNSIKAVFFLMALSVLIIITYSIVVIINDGFSKRLKVKNFQKKHTFAYLTQDDKPCFGRTQNLCNFGSHKKKIILLGDSHMGSLAFDLYNKTKSKYSFLPITNGGYFHLREVKQINKHSKKIIKQYDILRNNIDKILNKSNKNIIIIGGVTSLYIYNKRIENRALHWDGQFVHKDTLKYDTKTIERAFINLLKSLSANNEIILLYPIPEMGINIQKKKFENRIRIFNYKYSDYLKQNNEVIDFFNTINLPDVHKVYSYRVFCNETTGLCNTHDKDNFFFFDGYHPSLQGAKMINNLIVKKINLLEKNNER